jgi:starch synthase
VVDFYYLCPFVKGILIPVLFVKCFINQRMSKKKVLIVTQAMQPYTTTPDISETVRQLAPYLQDSDMEIRVLMPRFGTINERRHRLHEVVRLSGMNIIVDDNDYPLIIKVASLPEARMQVYFLDNEDFFKRKFVFRDENDQPFDDNADRMVFFCKGVIETVKKFGWSPDIVHCHGWMTSLVPLYLKTAYKTEPIFQHAKVIYSIYESKVEKLLGDTFTAKASINNLSESDLQAYQNGTGINLHKGAVDYSDALILGSKEYGESVKKVITGTDKPVLDVHDEDYLTAYMDFYQSLMAEEVEN